MKRVLYITTAAALLSLGVQAQSGRVVGLSEFTFTDMLQASQYNYGFGTARSAAMGGAFTSLGGDLSSMSINPAGLGMYRSSEFGISPSITFTTMDSKYSAPSSYQRDNSRTRFAPNNVSVALNLYQGSGSLTSFTLGVGYNKLSDFNTRSSIGFTGEANSIADIFALQLNRINIPEADLKSTAEPFYNTGIYPSEWGAVLGYQNMIIDPDPSGPNKYMVAPTMLAAGALTNPYMYSQNKGSIGEYSISGGMNFNNILYVGLSIGIQDIFMQQDLDYVETYSNNPEFLNTLEFNQRAKVIGSAVNFKLGVIARPVGGLRIGLAVHTPSMVSVDKVYSASIRTSLSNGESLRTSTPATTYDYNFTTPTRLLTGVSYTFGQWGVVTADYERVWYNGMRLSDNSNFDVEETFKDNIKYYCRGSNNFRVGFEFKPTSILALRGGYGYYGDAISKEAKNDGENVFNTPIANSTYNISAGAGVRLGNFTLDLAYIYANSKYTQYDFFFDNSVTDSSTGLPIGQKGLISTNQTRHIVTLSMGVKF